MLLVMALEGSGQCQHRALEEAGASACTIGGDRLEFRSQRAIQDGDVIRRVRGLVARRERISPRQQRHGGAGQRQAASTKETAARHVKPRGGLNDEDGHVHLLFSVGYVRSMHQITHSFPGVIPCVSLPPESS
jgi:hypothetical protein